MVGSWRKLSDGLGGRTLLLSVFGVTGATLLISSSAAAAAPSSEPPPLQTPSNTEVEGTTAPSSTAPAEVAPPPATNVPADAAPGEATVVPEITSTEAPADAAVDPNLLDANEPAATPTPQAAPQTASVGSQGGAEEATLARESGSEFRPTNNPGRLNITAHTLFANAGGDRGVGGRMGGVQADVGQSWNWIGYAVTVSAWGGRVYLPQDTGAEMNAMFGAGPTLSLGRLALVDRGFIDFRIGYDFYYGVVNRRRDDAGIVATQGDPSGVTLIQTENLAPHGPRARLDMGLLLGGGEGRFWHAVGVSAGYQGLVGSFRGELPFTHMLTLGLAYWMG